MVGRMCGKGADGEVCVWKLLIIFISHLSLCQHNTTMLFDTHHHITMLIQAPEYFQCLDDNYSNAGHACHPTIVLNDELDLQ